MKASSLVLVFLLGAWCAGTVFMWQVAIQSFAVAGIIQDSGDEGLRDAVEGLSDEGLRYTLRFLASEVNRLFFTRWGWIQIPLGIGVLGLSLSSRSGRRVTLLAGAMLAIVLVCATYITPETVHLGRLMDFAPADAVPEVRDAFWTLHHAFTGLDSVKLLLGLGAAALVCRRSVATA